MGKSYGQRSLAQSWVRKESDTTDHMHVHAHTHTHTHTHTIQVLKDGVQEIPGGNSYFYIHETQIEI